MAGIVDPFPAMTAKAQPPAVIPAAVPAVRVREIIAVLLLVVLGDLTLYRGAGFGGLALLLVASPALLLLGSPQATLRTSFWVVGTMLLLLAARVAWLGTAANIAIGAVLLVAFSLAIQGILPFPSRVLLRGLETTLAGGAGLWQYVSQLHGLGPQVTHIFLLSCLLPVGAVLLFGTFFVLANPDLATSFAQNAVRSFRQISEWMEQLSHNAGEVGVWILVAWFAAGLIRPLSTLVNFSPTQAASAVLPVREQTYYYPAIRNMFMAVIGLFAAYLVFEFATLWFRSFPPGFHYSGYAHEGAAWLTVALAASTLVLSLIFRGSILGDPRIGRLRLLAWIWSAQNLILALTVYNRMYIYIDFNGMTWMRTVGLFGITTVVVGFGLVLWKIVHNRDFPWLIQRQLWALAAAIYLFTLTPVDWLVHSYNARQVLAGDLAPSVQISEHPISAEGYFALQPILASEDEIIREGVRAMLAERYLHEKELAAQRQQLGWTSWQLCDQLLLDRLEASRSQWQHYLVATKREEALARFHKYAYQWY